MSTDATPVVESDDEDIQLIEREEFVRLVAENHVPFPMPNALMALIQQDSELCAGKSVREAMDNMSYKELALMYRQLKQFVDDAEDAVSLAKGVLEYMTEVTVPGKLDDDGMKNTTLKGIGRWQVSGQLRVSTIPDKKEALFAWMRDTGNEPMITEHIAPSTLKAFVGEQMKKGKPYPEDCLNVHAYSKASLVKA